MSMTIGGRGGNTSLGFAQSNYLFGSLTPIFDDMPDNGPLSDTGQDPQSSTIGATTRSGIAVTTAVGVTGNFTNQDINGILSGYAWGAAGANVTFSFPTSGAFYGANYPTSGGLDPSTTGFQVLTAAQQNVARYAFGLMAQYTGITFSEITETALVHANIRLAGSSAPPTSYARYPSSNYVGAGDVWFGNVRNSPPDKASYAFSAAFLHEIGHAVGLKHGQEPDATYGVLPAAHGSTEYSVMDYRDYIGDSAGSGYGKGAGSGNQTYMSSDISALQYLYGANFNTYSGNTTYTWSDTTGEMFIDGVGQTPSTANKIFEAVWDGNGVDTMVLTNYTTNMTISLLPGEWSTFSTAQLADLNNDGLHLALGNIIMANLYNGDTRSLIERVYTGTGADSITGNLADNLFYGNTGNDTIRGLTGSDTAWMDGASGATAVTLLGADHYQTIGPSGTDELYGIERLAFGASAETNTPVIDVLPSASTLPVGTSILGDISVAFEHDWYAMSLISGATYWFDMQGSPDGNGTLTDSYLTLYSDDITVAASNDDGGAGPNSFLAYTAATTATYWLDARHFWAGTGSYLLSSAIADDYASNPSTTGTIAIGSSVNAAIDTAGDRDWFTAELFSGTTYWFELKGAATGNGTLSDPFLSVWGSDGTVNFGSSDDQGTGLNSFFAFTPASTGTYHLEASGFSTATGSYQLSAAIADDYAANPSTTGTIAIGSSVNAAIDTNGDRDWFTTVLFSGTTYWFELKGAATGNGTLSDPFLSVWGSDGTVNFGSSDDQGAGLNSFYAFTPASTGTYHLEARGFSTGTGTYQLSAAIADDFAANPSTTGTIAATPGTAGNTVNGTIDTGGDDDWFAASLTAGVTYWISARGVDSNGGTLPNPALQVRGNDGQALLSTNNNSGTGLDGFIDFTPDTTGTYHISVTGNGGTGTYQLGMQVADDAAANAATSVTMVPTSSIVRTLNFAGDHDWVSMSLLPGNTYWFDLRGEPTGNGTLYDPRLALRTADGVSLITTDDDRGSGYDSFISYSPAFADTYYFDIYGSFLNTGTYQFIAAIADDYAGNASSTGTIAPGGAVVATIDHALDEDVFAASLIGGTTYWFSLAGASTSSGSLANPTLTLRSDNGVLAPIVASDDNSGIGTNAFFAYTPAVNGTYYIDAKSADGLNGTYTLTLDIADDYAANPGTAGTVNPGTNIAGSIETAGDIDWVNTTLTAGVTYWINLQGAPTGWGTAPDPVLTLYGNDGLTVIATDDNSGTGANPFLAFTPAITGIYQLAAAAPGGTGTYALDVQVADDFKGNTTANIAIVPGGFIAGNVDFGGDEDWFPISLIAGKTYWFNEEGSPTGQGTLTDPYLRLSGADGVPLNIATDDDSGTGYNASIAFTPLTSGTYFLTAGSTGGTGTYILTAAIADAYAGNASTTGLLAPGGLVTSALSPAGDTDWFAASLTAGTTYWISMAGIGSLQGTLAAPSLTVNLDDGTSNTILITESGSGIGTDAFASFTPANTGSYYIGAAGLANATGTYKISLAIADDYGSIPGNAGTITDGTSNTATIDSATDTDWFATTLTAGITYWFSADGSANGGGTLANPYLRLYGADSATSLAFDNDSGAGTNAFLRYTPAATGLYHLSAQSVGGATGTYIVREAIADDYAPGPATSRTLAVNTSVNAVISYAGDTDWFRVNLQAGKTYWFNQEGSPTAKGTLNDSYLRLFANDGVTEVTANDDGGVGNNSSISYTPAVTATFYLSAEGYYTNTGTYRLTSSLADDFDSTPATTGTIAPGDSLMARVHFVGDTDWFTANLTGGTTYWFTADGLDAGKGTLTDPLLRILGDDGATVLGNNNDSGIGNSAFLRYTPLLSGTYHISAQGAGGAIGTYRLSEQVADDAPAAPITTRILLAGGNQTGDISFPGDTDWFRTTLTAGVIYRFDHEGLATGQGTLSNPNLRLFSDDGRTVVAFDNDSGVGNNAQITYTPAITGSYYVSAQGISTTTGTYRVSETIIPPGPGVGLSPAASPMAFLIGADDPLLASAGVFASADETGSFFGTALVIPKGDLLPGAAAANSNIYTPAAGAFAGASATPLTDMPDFLAFVASSLHH